MVHATKEFMASIHKIIVMQGGAPSSEPYLARSTLGSSPSAAGMLVNTFFVQDLALALGRFRPDPGQIDALSHRDRRPETLAESRIARDHPLLRGYPVR